MVDITKLSTLNKIILVAYYKGYRVRNGIVYNSNNKVVKKHYIDNRGYLRFSCNVDKYLHQRIGSVRIHKFVAFQKFGDKVFEPNIVVRHLDGDQTNNHEDNIEIGTQSDNVYDRCPIERLTHSIKAATQNRKFTDKEMEHIRELNKQGVSYKELMKRFNISSKGTLSYIINTKYKTKK